MYLTVNAMQMKASKPDMISSDLGVDVSVIDYFKEC